MSLHVIHVTVAERLEKLQRDFLWWCGGENFRYHLVDWGRICQPKEVGDLGVRRLVQFNRALLGKWLWRFARERDCLWRKVMASKFGVGEGDWRSGEMTRSHGRDLWKGIFLENGEF